MNLSRPSKLIECVNCNCDEEHTLAVRNVNHTAYTSYVAPELRVCMSVKRNAFINSLRELY